MQNKPVKTAADLSPAPILDRIKAFVSPKSTAGTLRDRQLEIDKKIKQAGG